MKKIVIAPDSFKESLSAKQLEGMIAALFRAKRALDSSATGRWRRRFFKALIDTGSANFSKPLRAGRWALNWRIEFDFGNPSSQMH
ncbi:hypothetical protein HQ393_14515 [Chitinibacter bivalviorum]|uniref:Glycerate kinase n=1 Tax=Chitinibacter bivalviorum TaxID=2739434 RepID=A0A7H9BL05_9NEIS|nr:hypothetical protein [Chitinibacter bivalviorum]QLG89360.1 hypothetical protein HQ393_14515 [Chitinibacter bivalviorum]